MNRNYNNKPQNKKNQPLLCCPVCNKKYRSEQKRQQHVEKFHYYKTRNSNNYKFDHNLKAQIYDSAIMYVGELDKIINCHKNNIYYGETSAKNLLPQLYGKDVSPDELKRIMAAQLTFAERIQQENLTMCDWKVVMEDLEHFLNLGMPFYDTNFCPTMPIDFLWHALMQCPELYVEVCKKSCRVIIPHCNNERPDSEDARRYMYFLDLFKHRFGREPYQFSSNNECSSFSCADIKQMFANLRDAELEEIENIRIQKENEKKRGEEECEKFRVAREKIDKEILENTGINLQNMGLHKREFYLNGYKNGLNGLELKKCAEDAYDKYINSDSYREWAKC